MPRGELENTSGASLTIESLGWVLPTGHTETLTESSSNEFRWVTAEPELSSLITANDIEIRSATGITILSSGILDWIGAATVDGPQQHVLTAMVNQRIPNAGERFLGWNTAISHTEVAWPTNSTYTLLRIVLGVSVVDSVSGFGVNVYDSSDLNTTVFSSAEILPLNTLEAGIVIPITPTPVTLAASSYAWSVIRTSGTGSSTFTKLVMNAFLQREN